MYEDAQVAALESGVIGFAYKGERPSRLLETIRDCGQEKEQDINPNGA